MMETLKVLTLPPHPPPTSLVAFSSSSSFFLILMGGLGLFRPHICNFFSTNVLLGSIFLHMKARKLWQNFAYMATFLFGQLYCSKGIFSWSGFYRLNVPGAVVACRCLITMYKKLTLGQTCCGLPYWQTCPRLFLLWLASTSITGFVKRLNDIWNLDWAVKKGGIVGCLQFN